MIASRVSGAGSQNRGRFGSASTGTSSGSPRPENETTLRRGCFAANTAAELGRRDPAAMKIVRSTFERMESVLEETLVEGQERGEFDDALDAKAVASLLLATLVGITVLARVDGPSARTKRIALAVAALL